MAIDQITLTDAALLNINRKISNLRKYDGSLIDTRGTLTIVDGVASDFDPNSYTYKENLSFSSNLISLHIPATYSENEKVQTLFQLIGTSRTFTLRFQNNTAQLFLNTESVLSLSNLQLSDDIDLKVYFNLAPKNCELTIKVNNDVFSKTVVLPQELVLSSFNKVILGNETPTTENYWDGSINLTNFTILDNQDVIFTPSTYYPMKFTKIIVSDGTFPLTNTSTTIARHMYEFEITEIAKSANTALLATSVNNESQLIIRELGIYVETEEGELLFGYINNLNIKKGEGVPYDLVITINIYLNFVNLTGFPVIELNIPETVILKKFNTIRDTMTYVFMCLERLIAMNATDLGYDRAQVFYRLNKEMTEQEDCYSNIQTYSKLIKKIKRHVDTKINPDVFQIFGNFNIPENGNVSGFSTTDYLGALLYLNPEENWELSTSFNIPENVLSGTVISFGSPTQNQPLGLNVVADENDKPTLHASLGQLETMDLTIYNENYSYDRYPSFDSALTYINGALVSPRLFYSWNYTFGEGDTVETYNFHTTGISGIQTTATFIPSNITNSISWTPGILDTSNWNFTLTFKTPLSFSTLPQYLVGSADSTDSPFSLFIDENRKLNLTLSNPGITFQSANDLNLNSSYTINLSFQDGIYSLVCSNLEDSTSEVLSTYSSTLVELTASSSFAFGSNNNSNKFTGEINFSSCTFVFGNITWNAAVLIQFAVYTETINPDSSATLYDNDGYILPNTVTHTAATSHIIANKNTFEISPNTDYYVKISYDSSEGYKLSYSTDKETYEEVSLSEDINPINFTQNVLIGVSQSYSNSLNPTIGGPFLGELHLLDFLFLQESATWNPIAATAQNTELLQYYSLPNLSRAQYTTQDINHPQYTLYFSDETFKGNEDLIDFTDSNGLTLCMKVYIKDSAPKLLLAKTDLLNNPYFTLTYINQKLKFTLYRTSGDIVLEKDLEVSEYSEFQSAPILLTINLRRDSISSQQLLLYRNNDLELSVPISLDNLYPTTGTFLTNFLQEDVIRSICANEGTETQTPEEIAQKVIDNVDKYMQSIIVFSGSLTPEQIYYITNLTDTNF